MTLLWSTIIATLVGFASAAVFPRDSGFHTLSQDQISSTNPYAYYSAAVKCNPQNLPYWNCGVNCDNTPNFQLYKLGGDGNQVPFFFVGYDSNIDTIIVSRQGSDKQFLSDLNNAQASFTSLDPKLFSNITNAAQVYKGFADIQAQSAPDVIQAVYSLLATYQGASVTTVGHSVGGAFALLDGIFLRMQLDPTVDVRIVTYGTPRVGNDVFASLADAMLAGRVKHINNKKDPVPIVPAITLGFHQTSGEIHIQDSGAWIECPGDDNADPRCIAGTVTNIGNAQWSDHPGPYNGVMIKCN